LAPCRAGKQKKGDSHQQLPNYGRYLLFQFILFIHLSYQTRNDGPQAAQAGIQEIIIRLRYQGEDADYHHEANEKIERPDIDHCLHAPGEYEKSGDSS
jgi:hypothetical protein